MDRERVMEKFLSISTQLTAEKDRDVLLSSILDCAMDAANCDAGTLYMLRNNELHFCRIFTRSLGVRQGGHDAPINLPPVPMDPKYVSAWVAIHVQTINVPDVRESTLFDFTGSAKYDEMTGYRTKSMLVIPMLSESGEMIGVTQLINAKDENGETVPFDANIEKLVCAISSQAAISIANMNYVENLTRITAERERIQAELSIAAHIQLDMMPTSFPERSEFDIYAMIKPAKEVGGDFYDFFMVDDCHLAMVVADVSGKGIPAALFAMMARAMIKMQTRLKPDPHQVLMDVSAALYENNTNNMFVTAWLGILNVNTGKLVYADAGHERMLLYQNGEWQILPKQGGVVLAVFSAEEMAEMPEKRAFRNCELQLSPGDMILQYTDGITEATDAQHAMFGEERLLAAAKSIGDQRPEDLIGGVHRVIDDFVGAAPQFDDMTMLCLKKR